MLTVFTAAIQGCMRSSKIHPKRVCHSGLRMSNCAAASSPSSGDSEGRAQQPRQEVWTGKAGRKQGIIPRPPMLETKAGRLICRNKSPKEVPPASGHDSRELNLCISQSFRQPDTAGRLTQLSQQPADVFFIYFPRPPWYAWEVWSHTSGAVTGGSDLGQLFRRNSASKERRRGLPSPASQHLAQDTNPGWKPRPGATEQQLPGTHGAGGVQRG